MTVSAAGAGRHDPAYGTRSVADVAGWVMSALGLEPPVALPDGFLPPPDLESLVLLVFDGLGAQQVRDYSEVCPFIASLDGESITSTCPSTTSTALTSLCTGTVPAVHGILGYVFRSTAGMLNVVKYAVRGQDARGLIDPFELQTQGTLFDRATAAGANSWIVTADEFKGSGFTSVFLRGGMWRGWRKAQEMPELVLDVLPLGMRSLVYAYYDGLDVAGHVGGVGSRKYLGELQSCDEIARSIASGLTAGQAMVILSDHGMVNVPAENRVFVEDAIDSLCSGVGGEARCRYLYAKPGMEKQLLEASAETWDGWAWVLSADEAIVEGLYGGDLAPENRYRLGDVLVFARDSDRGLFKRGRSKFIPTGNHGSLTPEEMEVPFRLVTG